MLNPQLLMPFLTGADRPPANPGHTKAAGLDQVQPRAGTQRALILSCIRGRYDYGATRNEISMATGMRINVVCGRCNELLKSGLIWQGKDLRDGGKVLRAK